MSDTSNIVLRYIQSIKLVKYVTLDLISANATKSPPVNVDNKLLPT